LVCSYGSVVSYETIGCAGRGSDLAWYVSHVERRDDRAALFAPYLPAGVYRYEYTVQLTTRGVFGALPAHVEPPRCHDRDNLKGWPHDRSVGLPERISKKRRTAPHVAVRCAV
jgi:Bacterial Alpha-2-macroglobulin MG10 domain